MRLLVDEDLASRELIARLELVLPGRVSRPVPGMPDDEVWTRAQHEGAAVLTGNVADFLAIVGTGLDHHGLLLVYRTNDPRRDLRAADIAAGVGIIVAAHPDSIDGAILVINDAIRPAPSARDGNGG